MVDTTARDRQRHFDIAVVGGGLVGASAAVACARAGYRVALLDRACPTFTSQYADDEWDNRIYALTPGNIAWLQQLGVWGSLEQNRVCQIERMQVYANAYAQPLTFDAYHAHTPSLGSILEGRHLLAALWSQMQELQVHILTGVELQSLQTVDTSSKDTGTTLLLADGQVLHAELLVAADGGQSQVRELSGITADTLEYQQMGVVANFASELPHGHVARQWFTDHGVLAWLPLPGKRISMVWSTDQAEQLLALSPAQLATEVAAVGQQALGELQPLNNAVAYPLFRQTARQLVQPGIALVGDAAHQIHPLAGQGVNLGLRDVIALLNSLGRRSQHQALGDYFVLRDYERSRKADIWALGAVTHGLHSLFAQQSPMLRKLRETGMAYTERQLGIKQHLIQQAII